MNSLERLKSGLRGWSPKLPRMREARVFHDSPTAVCGERAFGFWQSSDSMQSAEKRRSAFDETSQLVSHHQHGASRWTREGSCLEARVRTHGMSNRGPS